MIEAGRAELETGRKQRERPNPDCQLIAASLNAFDNIKVANIFNDAIRMRDMRDMRDIVGNNYGRWHYSHCLYLLYPKRVGRFYDL